MSSRETERIEHLAQLKGMQQHFLGMYADGMHTQTLSGTFSKGQAVEVVQKWAVPGSSSSLMTFCPAHVLQQEGPRVLVQMDNHARSTRSQCPSARCGPAKSGLQLELMDCLLATGCHGSCPHCAACSLTNGGQVCMPMLACSSCCIEA